MIRVLVTGDDHPDREDHLNRLARWNGGLELMPGGELRGIDLVLAFPGDKGRSTLERARSLGYRIAEVVDGR